MKLQNVYLLIPILPCIVSCGGSGHKFNDRTLLGAAYSVITNGDGEKPAEGQFVVFTMEQRTGNDRLVLESKGIQKYRMSQPMIYGDLADMLTNLSKGDSAVFRLEADKLYHLDRPRIMQGEKYLYIYVRVLDVMSEDAFHIWENATLRDQMADDIERIKRHLHENGVEGWQMTDKGIFYLMEVEGPGRVAKPGETVTIYYDGYLPDSIAFQTTKERGGPVELRAGKGDVIPAFDEAVMTFPAGSKMKLFVPSRLAYGHGGITDRVPSNQWVWFDVEIVDKEVLLRSDQAQIMKYLKERNLEAIKDEEGFFYTIERQGNGVYPKMGQMVSVFYTGRFLDGTVFDSSDKMGGEPASFDLRYVVNGWQLGMQKFDIGSKGTLYLPSPLAYGERGSKPKIAPNTIIIFDIELVDIIQQQ